MGETQKKNAWNRLDEKFDAKHPEIWKIVKWMIVGFIANVPELGAYMLCLHGFRAAQVENLSIFGFMQKIIPPNEDFHIAVVIYAYMISTAVGYAVAFVLNRKATFHADANLALSTFLYVLMVCMVIYVNGVTGPFLSRLVGMLNMPVNLSEGVSKFLSMMLAGVLTYPITRFVIHRKKKAAPPSTK
jgi:putative flippase GtrA